MISSNKSTNQIISDLLEDDQQVQEAVQEAQINALKEHALRGGKLPIEKDGQIEWVLASELLKEQRALKDCRSNSVE